MEVESSSHLTLVFKGSNGDVAYDRDNERWHVKDGQRYTFNYFKTKYPKRCREVLNLLIDSDGHSINKARWNAQPGRIELKLVVAELRYIIDQLGYKGEEVIENEWGEGYRIIPRYLLEPPQWMVEYTHDRVEPRLSWVEALIELVSKGRSAWLSVLPGNGAEDADEVCERLRSSLSDARFIKVDISTIKDKRQLFANIAAEALDTVETLTAYSAGTSIHHRLARAVAGPNKLLGLVVEGWGTFAQRNSAKSLKEIADALHGFKRVNHTPVPIVLLSPTSVYHLLPQGSVGSLLVHLQKVAAQARDAEEVEKWGAEHLTNISRPDAMELLETACGQLGAIRKAVKAAQQNLRHDERLRAVADAHAQAGQYILGAVGPCCRNVLLGKLRREGCYTELIEATILEKDVKGYRLRVPTWATAWSRTGRIQ